MKYTSIEKRTSVFLITRFNLNFFPRDKKNLPTRTDSWLSERFNLFDRFCFASVYGQTFKDFIWIVLFDINTPEEYKKKIHDYEVKMSNFLPVFMDDEEARNHRVLIKDVIIEHKDDTQALITTRVDNDDALHKDFIRQVVDLYDLSDDVEHYYTFKNGLQFYTEANLTIQLPYEKNHFPALILKNYKKDSFRHVMELDHYFIAQYGIPITYINNKDAMWIEVVHGHNIGNDVIFTFNQKAVYETELLKRNFNCNILLDHKNTRKKFWLFFIPRFCSQVIIRGTRRVLIMLKLKSEYTA